MRRNNSATWCTSNCRNWNAPSPRARPAPSSKASRPPPTSIAPLAGKIVEINETIVEDPSIVNSDAEGEGWFFRLELDDPDAFEALMDQDGYDEYLETL